MTALQKATVQFDLALTMLRADPESALCRNLADAAQQRLRNEAAKANFRHALGVAR